jgi:hypothetical protein
MRFCLPEGCVGVTYAGEKLVPRPDGSIEADATAAAALAPHGILPLDESPPAPARDTRARGQDRKPTK